LNGSGNTLNNVVVGNAGDNNLYGLDGNDLLQGGIGSDILDGGSGDDFLIGGAGQDLLLGGPGADEADFGIELRRSYSFNASTVTLTPIQGYLGDSASSVESLAFFDGTLVVDAGSDAAQVFRIYKAALGRVPDSMGLSNWTAAHEFGGLTLVDVAAGFVGSAEFVLRYGGLTNEQFVSLLYQNVLGRGPDPAGAQHWVSQLQAGVSRAEILIGFSESQEHVQITLPAITAGLWIQDLNAGAVARLYDTAFDRLPDAGGLINWTSAIESGMALVSIANQFVTSAEFSLRYGTLSNAEFVQLLYVNVLNREADQAGAANWTNALNNGMSRADVVLQFSESPEHIILQAPYIDHGIWFGG
ncbi:MAG: DUF4214 domain-containing protein, partial [Devosia sp.]